MRRLCVIAVLLSLAMPAAGQNPADLSFVLATKDGRSTFRLGEQIDLEFRFTSTSSKKYQVQSCDIPNRGVVMSSDNFFVTPEAGTNDPIRDLPELFDFLSSCLMGEPVFLNSVPVVQDRILNEWISFRQAGRFRIQATTRKFVSVPLISNAIDIEILQPETGWTERQLHEATTVLATSLISHDKVVRAVRVLRFLGTLEAATALAEAYVSRPSRDLRLGLFGSPYRSEILAKLRADIENPDVPISGSTVYENAFEAFVALSRAAETGPRPLPTEQLRGSQYEAADRAYIARFEPKANQYRAEFAAAACKKRGQARSVTLETLRAARIPAPCAN